jgi:hypothetical protein
MPLSNEKFAEMRAEKSCSSCNQSPFHFVPPAQILLNPLLLKEIQGD